MKDLLAYKILVYDYRNGISIAQKLAESFGVVFYFCPYATNGFPEHTPFDVGNNVPNIVKVKEWTQCYDEVDMVMFTDSMEPYLQNWMKNNGKPVFGSVFAEKLEHDRLFIKETLKELGLPVGNYSVAHGIDELEQVLMNATEGYVKSSLRGNGETWKHKEWKLSKRQIIKLRHEMGLYENRETYVFEHPLEALIEFGYDGFICNGFYVPISQCGVERKDACYLGRFIHYQLLPEQIRTINDKLALIFEQMGYNGHYSNEIIVTKDKRGHLIDNTCFSSDTEVLTDTGWKFFFELDGSEKICTLNPQNKNIEYHIPYKFISYNFTGEMISISNRKKTIECLVTPNHSVWRTDRNGNGLFEEEAGSLTDRGYILRSGKWITDDVCFFKLPKYEHRWDFNSSRGGGYKICERVKVEFEKDIKMDYWIAFMAWYLSEGSIGGRKYKNGIANTVNIAQKKFIKEISEVLDACGFKYRYTSGVGFEINSIQLCAYLKKYGLCDKKYIPSYIKNASGRQVRIFLDNYILGDGDSIEKRKYFTTSKEMADGIQELLLKVGSVGNISIRKCKGTPILGLDKVYNRNHDLYIISENKNQHKYWFETGCRKSDYIKKEKYDGLVYDVTVQNHILYVRRNGKPFFSGNCRFPSPPGELMLEAYTNYAEIVWDIAHGKMPVIEFKHEWGAQLIIKSDIAQEDPSPILVPDKYKKYIKIKNLSIDEDGTWYFVPSPGLMMKEIGSIVFTADTQDAVIKGIIEIAESIQGFDICIDTDSLYDAKKALDKLSKYGIKYV